MKFLSDRKHRVVVDGVTTKFVDINRRVPQGTVLGPVLFSKMVDDTTAANPSSNLLVKYADGITLSVRVRSRVLDQSQAAEVNNIQCWATENRMPRNLKKTLEMILRRKTNYILPQVRIERFKRCFMNRCLFWLCVAIELFSIECLM